MYQDKLASLKRQLQQLQEGNFYFFFGCYSFFYKYLNGLLSSYMIHSFALFLWHFCDSRDPFLAEVFEGHGLILTDCSGRVVGDYIIAPQSQLQRTVENRSHCLRLIEKAAEKQMITDDTVLQHEHILHCYVCF